MMQTFYNVNTYPEVLNKEPFHFYNTKYKVSINEIFIIKYIVICKTMSHLASLSGSAITPISYKAQYLV